MASEIHTRLEVTSAAFAAGHPIPHQYTCEGIDVSPPLAWSTVSGTRSFAIVCSDPDAPGGKFHHWGVWGIPAATHSIPEGFGTAHHLGVHHAANDFRVARYRGPCPPHGHGMHRYVFKVYALNAEVLPLAERCDCSDLAAMAHRHALAEGELIGTYSR